ncbi:hypothetical protein XFF6166_690032 [Xanthomonas citri pv. fuscans]|nr:hypothetical protein XFF6166_690032 [Xanthomonas citri pv. fuscans]SOO02398.1 hypothetical protein XFF6960_600003 [Xanthomonas citri pv. fuscans]SOO10868.1 hypothetical protein XFF6970_660091 [Xanthomonas citri pv. fuscans]SOO44834.1 hypothetical protein XFF1815_660032 [Xanthomonas citri pv. fuscans]
MVSAAARSWLTTSAGYAGEMPQSGVLGSMCQRTADCIAYRSHDRSTLDDSPPQPHAFTIPDSRFPIPLNPASPAP